MKGAQVSGNLTTESRSIESGQGKSMWLFPLICVFNLCINFSFYNFKFSPGQWTLTFTCVVFSVPDVEIVCFVGVVTSMENSSIEFHAFPMQFHALSIKFHAFSVDFHAFLLNLMPFRFNFKRYVCNFRHFPLNFKRFPLNFKCFLWNFMRFLLNFMLFCGISCIFYWILCLF